VSRGTTSILATPATGRNPRSVAAEAKDAGARRLRLLQMFLALTALIVLFARSLPPYSAGQDFIQDYVSGRALLAGDDPYAPLNELIHRYVPAGIAHFDHANPHPPLLILLGAPFALLPYQAAPTLWLALNVALLVLIGKWLNLSGWGRLALLAWPPLWSAVALGGSEVVLLALALATWRLADARRDGLAGGVLGLAAALKLFPVFFFLPYAAQRRFRLLFAGGVVVGLGQIVNLALVGPARLAYYYLHALPASNQVYVATVVNVAPYGALLRIFGGASDVRAALPAPFLPPALAAIVSLAGLAALCRMRPRAAPLAFLVATPIAWTNYVSLSLPQLLDLWRVPDRRLAVWLATAAASWVLPVAIAMPAFQVAIAGAGAGASAVLALLGAVQPAGLIALLVLSWRGERSNECAGRSAGRPAASAARASSVG
jgi:hypothetical protein